MFTFYFKLRQCFLLQIKVCVWRIIPNVYSYMHQGAYSNTLVCRKCQLVYIRSLSRLRIVSLFVRFPLVSMLVVFLERYGWLFGDILCLWRLFRVSSRRFIIYNLYSCKDLSTTNSMFKLGNKLLYNLHITISINILRSYYHGILTFSPGVKSPSSFGV